MQSYLPKMIFYDQNNKALKIGKTNIDKMLKTSLPILTSYIVLIFIFPCLHFCCLFAIKLYSRCNASKMV